MSDFWSSTLQLDVQLAGSQPRDRREIFTHTRAVKDVTLQDPTVNAACVASVRVSRKGHGTERRQSSLVLCRARSGTRKVWILQRLRRDVVWQRRETRCRDLMARSAKVAMIDVRPRGPANTAYGGGATRASKN